MLKKGKGAIKVALCTILLLVGVQASYAETISTADIVKIMLTIEKPLYFSPASPVLGNPNGTVTLIEFEDYQDADNIRMYPIINELIKKNPNLRVVIKELPIYSDASRYAAEMALTYNSIGDFKQIHNALYGRVIKEGILKTVDVDTIIKKLPSSNKVLPINVVSQVTNELTQNFQLSKQLYFLGNIPRIMLSSTPLMNQPVTGRFMPEDASEEELQAEINFISAALTIKK